MNMWRRRELCGRRVSALLGLCALLLLPRGARAQYSTCNFSPSDVTTTEAWAAASGTILCGGTYNVQSFDIPTGVTVYVVAGSSVTINATDWIEITGSLNADFTGGVGGAGCVSGTSGRGGSGTGSGGGGGGISEYYGGFGGGGGAYGCSGSACGGSGGYPVYDTGSTAGGAPYDSNTSLAVEAGSGGGGGGCAVYEYPAAGENGGAGGGGISLIAPEVQIDAESEIFAYGANGSGGTTGGGGGGGSGGDITISANTILSVSASAYVEAPGGAGGAGGDATNDSAQYIGGGGGGGSGGRIKYFGPAACSPVGVVTGGGGGAGATLSGKSSAAGTAGGSGDLTCTAMPALTAAPSLSPSPVAPNTSTTVTAGANNPSGYLLLYQYDCTGTGTSYSAATSAATSTCSWSTTGTHTVDVKVLGYNAAPLINGTAAGGYLVTTVTATTSVVVGLNPTVSLTVPATGNIGQSVSLEGSVTDRNAATSYSYAWTFGDGSTTSADSTLTTNTEPHTYETPATEMVTLTVTDSLGFVGSATTTIAIGEVDPTLTIGTLPSPIHAGIAATFTATASSPSTAATATGFVYIFAWGDGSDDTTVAATASNTSVSQSHDYATPGTYLLTVTATDEFGGSDSQSVMVTVIDPAPVVSLDSASYSVALDTPLTVTGTASSSYAPAEAAGFTFAFSWGDGATTTTSSGATSPQAPAHAWDAPGTYTLKLTVTDDAGVASSTTATITVTQVAPVVTIGTLPVPAYAGASTSFSASATSVSTSATAAGFTYVFSWGDGTANTTIAATADNGSGVSTPHTYATTGSFTLTVTATDKYSETGTKSASVTIDTKAPAVTLSLSATTIPINAAVTATATATASYAPDGANGYTFVYSWGDGSPNTTVTGTSPQAPTRAYDTVGTFTVTLSVTDATGVASTATKSITVTDVAPTVTIGALPVPVYAGVSETYTASATSPSTTYTADGFTYVFAWGDGTTSTTLAATAGNASGVTATHAYAAGGPYTLTVTVTDKAGTSASSTAAVTLYSKAPAVTLTLSAATVAIETAVTATTTATASYPPDDANGFTFVYSWGDGTAGTTLTGTSPQAPTHAYDIAGTFTVSVSVTDNTGVATVAAKSITVTDVAPTVTIGTLPVPGYAGTSATFTASATSPSTTYTTDGFTYLFAWGDGTTSNTIAASSGNGSGVSTTHTYATAGTFTLTVTATDAAGTSKSTTAAVTIDAKAPAIGLSLSAATVPIETAVTATATATASYAPDGANGFSFVFSWGDGTANTTVTGASPQAPTHSYDVPGTYTITLTVTDATGVASATSKSIAVTDTTPTLTIGPLPVPVHSGIGSTFAASATSPSNAGTLAGFTWVFAWGDGTPNTTIAPTASNGTVSTTHTYASAGTFTLTVTVTDKYGGTASKTASVVVYNPQPTVLLQASPTAVAIGATLQATITAASAYAGDSTAGFTGVVTWGDGTSTTVTGGSPLMASHVYGAPGPETIQVSVTDATGIAALASEAITVTEVVPTVTLGPVLSPIDAVTTTATFSATATSPSAAATLAGFAWVFAWGDGTPNTTIAAVPANGMVTTTHVFPTPGTFTVSVTATDEFNGSASATAVVTALDPIPTVAFGAPSYTGSAAAAVSFTATASSPLGSDNSAKFTWSFDWGDGNTSSVTGTSPLATTHTYDAGGAYTATVTATDVRGTASAPATTSVVIGNVAPTITQFMHPNGLYGTPISFSLVVTDASQSDTAAGFEIVWDFGDGTPTQTGMNLDTVTHTYAAPGTYTVTVTVTDENSLQATATGTTVVADTVPVVSLGGNQTILQNNPVTLTPTITPYNPAWTYTYAWSLGDQTTASTSTVTKSYSTFGMYTVSLTVTDPYGASGSASIVLTVVDAPPEASSVTITPSAPDPQQALTLSYTYASAVNDPENGTTIVWYLNNQAVAAYDNALTIPAAAVQRNQTWYAVVTPSDGFLAGAPVQSNTVTVGDPPPSALNVAITPAEPRHADTLVLMYTYSDPYGYAEAGTTIAWTRNGVVQANLANQRSVPAPLTRGDVWQVTVTPSDGVSIGTSVASAPVTVQDTPPVLGPLPNIAETATMLLTPASWTVSGTDADNDPLTFDCAIGSKDLGPGPSYTASFPVGTTVVTCSVSDGTDTTTGTFQVAIGDVPPVVAVPPSQTINPGAVSLTATGQDPLGRPITYQWSLVSGPATVPLTGASTASVTLTPFAAGNYVLACIVSNGAEQASAQTTVTVAQLAPLVNLGPGPRTMVAGETITLDGSHSVDPNGGALSYKWAITSGLVQLSSATSPTVTVTASIGGQATVTLTVSDGVLSATGALVIDIWSSALGSPVAPIAVVDADQTVLAGTPVVLDGTGSFDPSADVLKYVWTQQSGPASVTLQQATAAQAQFVPQGTGTYVFQLTVSDAVGSSSALSTVTVLPQMGDQLPTAVATPSDLTVQVGGTAAIDGTASSALAGHPLTYQWTRVSGPYVVLTDATKSVCQVTPYGEGEIVVQLVVNDGTFSSLPAQVTIHATEGVMTSPTATAQVTPPSYVGLPVTLNGSGSTDPNGLPLLYQWQQLTGAPAVIHGSETAQASFTPADSGAASFQLTVFDWIFGTSAQVLVSVQGDVVPVAVATAPAVSYVGQTVTLDGTQSHDPEGRPLTFTWTQVIGPIVTLENATTASPTFTPAGDGTYVFQLVVSNGLFTSSPVTVTTQVQHYPTLHGGGCTSVPGADWLGVVCLLVALWWRRPQSHPESRNVL